MTVLRQVSRVARRLSRRRCMSEPNGTDRNWRGEGVGQ